MTKTSSQMQLLVRLIEKEAAGYGMRLNPDKVKLIAMKPTQQPTPILLSSGTAVGLAVVCVGVCEECRGVGTCAEV